MTWLTALAADTDPAYWPTIIQDTRRWVAKYAFVQGY